MLLSTPHGWSHVVQGSHLKIKATSHKHSWCNKMSNFFENHLFKRTLNPPNLWRANCIIWWANHFQARECYKKEVFSRVSILNQQQCCFTTLYLNKVYVPFAPFFLGRWGAPVLSHKTAQKSQGPPIAACEGWARGLPAARHSGVKQD